MKSDGLQFGGRGDPQTGASSSPGRVPPGGGEALDATRDEVVEEGSGAGMAQESASGVDERALESVLAGLRDATPAAGLEQRVLAALASRRAAAAAEDAVRGVRGEAAREHGDRSARLISAAGTEGPARRRFAAPGIAAAALLCVAAGMAVRYATHSRGVATAPAPATVRPGTREAEVAGTAPLEAGAAAGGTGLSGSTGVLPGRGVGGSVGASGTRSLPAGVRERGDAGAQGNPRAHRGARGIADGAAHEPEAPAENAESFPAPPLPLTEQERLLQRIAHHPTHGAQELALLDPVRRDDHETAEHVQFDNFFRPIPFLVLVKPTD